MTYRVSNGHVTDDVTWPWKFKLVTPIHLEHNISKTAGDRIRSKWPPIGNGLWDIKWSRHVTPKVLWGSTVGYPSLASCGTTVQTPGQLVVWCSSRLRSENTSNNTGIPSPKVGWWKIKLILLRNHNWQAYYFIIGRREHDDNTT